MRVNQRIEDSAQAHRVIGRLRVSSILEAQLFEDTTVTRPRPSDVAQMHSRGYEDAQSDLEIRRLAVNKVTSSARNLGTARLSKHEVANGGCID